MLVAAGRAGRRHAAGSRFGTLVTCTAFRNPALLAKMADTVDEISGGRLILGLGAGWHEPEYRAFGYPFDHRVGRFEEALPIIPGLLRDGHVDFAGRTTRRATASCARAARARTGPPILIGTRGGERMLRLTARYADVWNRDFMAATRASRLVPEDRAAAAAVDAACVEVGRDPATLERTAGVLVDLPGAIAREGWAARRVARGDGRRAARVRPGGLRPRRPLAGTAHGRASRRSPRCWRRSTVLPLPASPQLRESRHP